MHLMARVMRRLSGEEVQPNSELVDELLLTVTDRVNLLAGTETLPDILGSIVVDATIKMYRRQYYEGITTEGENSMSTSFIDNVLSEYMGEIGQYKQTVSQQKVVRFF